PSLPVRVPRSIVSTLRCHQSLVRQRPSRIAVGLHAPRNRSFHPMATKKKAAPKAHFPKIGTIAYEGPGSTNPLAFRHYNPSEVIDGRTLKEHLRFSIAYWHAFRGAGSDPFGPGTIRRPWEGPKDD